MHLSDGTPIELQITPCSTSSANIGHILANLIAQKLLSLTELLYSSLFGGCFNPFEEVLQEGERVMPGWKVGVETSESGSMLSVESVRLSLSEAGGLGEQSEILLDYDCGKFFLK